MGRKEEEAFRRWNHRGTDLLTAIIAMDALELDVSSSANRETGCQEVTR